MTFSLPPSSYRTLPPERARVRRVRVWDVAVTIVLLVLLTLFALAASYAGSLLAMAAQACRPTLCDEGVFNLGLWFGVLAPWVVLLVAVGATVVLLIKRRLGFWAPLAAAALMVGLWFVAAAIVGASFR
ncbi:MULTISPECIES: DUF6264 family protein [unclassified Microbacterium]|uniref:DUF6264 family protein n=1 Tax=unclassified Microbacterium TaxID=2609290 RepID=UPI0037454AF7